MCLYVIDTGQTFVKEPPLVRLLLVTVALNLYSDVSNVQAPF
jgi:hypothetical protein